MWICYIPAVHASLSSSVFPTLHDWLLWRSTEVVHMKHILSLSILNFCLLKLDIGKNDCQVLIPLIITNLHWMIWQVLLKENYSIIYTVRSTFLPKFIYYSLQAFITKSGEWWTLLPRLIKISVLLKSFSTNILNA